MILFFSTCATMPPQANNANPYITIDGKYDYYIREYYKDKNGKEYVLKSKQDTVTSAKLKLIEVEYLFISNDGKGNVIYMTTVPDRRQNRYSEHYLSADSVNMHDVRMIHFGKKRSGNKNKILFQGYKAGESDTWEIEIATDNSTVKINSILEVEKNELAQVMLVDSALNRSVIFHRVNPFHLVYHNHFRKDAVRSAVALNRFYYDPSTGGIVIYYDKIINKDNIQRYKKKRIVYDPKDLFH